MTVPQTKYYDVSHFQGPGWQPIWHSACKATQGTGYKDPEFVTYRSRIQSHGWQCMPYHYLEHGSIVDQVSNFLSVIGTSQSGMLDIERVLKDDSPRDPMLQDVLDFADEFA